MNTFKEKKRFKLHLQAYKNDKNRVSCQQILRLPNIDNYFMENLS